MRRFITVSLSLTLDQAKLMASWTSLVDFRQLPMRHLPLYTAIYICCYTRDEQGCVACGWLRIYRSNEKAWPGRPTGSVSASVAGNRCHFCRHRNLLSIPWLIICNHTDGRLGFGLRSGLFWLAILWCAEQSEFPQQVALFSGDLDILDFDHNPVGGNRHQNSRYRASRRQRA